jgi:hypothetical protein
MSEWIDGLAETFTLEPLSEDETDSLLRVAREVAHRVERKSTPLATFLVGMDVASRMAGGASREAAVNDSIFAIEALLPATPDPDVSP